MESAGIDIGGGETKAAVVDMTGKPEHVRDARGNKSMLSMVWIGPDGTTLVGLDAKEQGLVEPKHLARDFKRHLGTKEKFIDRKYDATFLFSVLLKEVKKNVEKQTGSVVEDVVMTIPANWKDLQRTAAQQAATMAGFKILRLITEPAAAAYCAACNENFSGRKVYVLCFDVGSTTTDVSMLEVENGVATVVATEGIGELGGTDMSDVIKRLLLEMVSKALGKPVTPDKLTPEQLLDLDLRAEQAKIALGSQPVAKVPLPIGGKHQLFEVKKDEYEAAILPLLKKVLKCADTAMAAANKTYKDVEMLVLAGGPCLSPFVQKVFAEHTGLVPKVKHDPSLVVAMGAALDASHQVMQKNGGQGFLRYLPTDRKLLLKEATAHDVGVAVVDESGGKRSVVNAVIVPKNTPVPCEKVEAFRLERETNTECVLEILQGSNGAPIKDCLSIGTIQLKGLPTEPQRSKRIEVKFRFDGNALVAVIATDLISKKSQTVTVQIQKP